MKRVFTEDELALLKTFDFTAEELEQLAGGMAPNKLLNRAKKSLEVFRKKMLMPPSRAELYREFISKVSFKEFFEKDFIPRINTLSCAINSLVAKGVISEEDIKREADRERIKRMRSLCEDCEKGVADVKNLECYKSAVKVKERFKFDNRSKLERLFGFGKVDWELLNKVIECNNFKGGRNEKVGKLV